MSAHCRKFSLYSLISALGISLAFIGVPSSTGAPQQSGALAGENPQSLEQPQSTSDEPDVLARSSDTTQPIGKLESAPHVDCSSMPWLDTSLSASKRADLLLSQSEETQVFRWLVEQPANYPSQNSFNGVDYSDQLPCTPTVNYTDGPEGIRHQGATSYPPQILGASTWDPELSYAKGRAMAEESVQKGFQGILAPGVSSGRTPLAGRTPEYFGEDSLLSGDMAAAGIDGIQSTPGVFANLKHFVANEQELDRRSSSSNIDSRSLHELYLRPFEIAVKKSDKLASVMCSYNQVNSTYACENKEVLQLLADKAGFTGFIMSDFGAVHSTAPSLNAGLDLELNRPKFYTPDLLASAVNTGSVDREAIYAAAHRVLENYFEQGLFDVPISQELSEDPQKYADKPTKTVETLALAKRLVEEGAVLLKNDDGVLPLSNTLTGKKVTVFGLAASEQPEGVGAQSICSIRGFRGATSMPCTDIVTAVSEISQRVASAGGQFSYIAGKSSDEVREAASNTDIAIIFGHQLMGEFSDITDLNLQDGGDELISTVARSVPDDSTTIVVLANGSAVEMPWIADVDSVMTIWYPGEQQGNALTSLLWGDTNFSGRLPMTFPKSLADTPTAGSENQYPGVVDENNIRQVDYAEGLKVGYRWYDSENITPLFPFGHGLSYTQFSYSAPTSSTSSSGDGTKLQVEFDVTNTGNLAGKDVPQLYLTFPTSADVPGKLLVGYQKTPLIAPGATLPMKLVISSDSPDRPLSIWDINNDDWRIPEGDYQLSLARSAGDIVESMGFSLPDTSSNTDDKPDAKNPPVDQTNAGNGSSNQDGKGTMKSPDSIASTGVSVILLPSMLTALAVGAASIGVSRTRKYQR